MENELHKKLLAEAPDGAYNTPTEYVTKVQALSALSALETALTEKHRAEVENPSQYDVNQLQQLINEAGDTHVEVHAFQLEGALDYINQLRTKNKRLRDYAQHKSNCDMGRLSMSVGVCTCGLDQLLTPQPASGKGGTDESKVY